MDDQQVTLSDVARAMYWAEDFGFDEELLTRGLQSAGLPPDNQQERARFKTLVKAANRLREGDLRAKLLFEVGDVVGDEGEQLSLDELIELAIEREICDDDEGSL